MKERNPIEIVNRQHQALYHRYVAAHDREERIMLLRRLVNLAQVMLFLVSSRNIGAH